MHVDTSADKPQASRGARLEQALLAFARVLGVAIPSGSPTPISVFKAKYGAVLRQVDDRGMALISRGQKVYVIVSAESVASAELVGRAPRTVADICRSLPKVGQRVEITEAQMSGVVGELIVPTRRT